MKKNKLLIIISSLLLIYTIIGFVVLPKILKPQIEDIINENLTQKASIEKIEFNPFLLKFSAYKLKIFDERETTISIKKLLIDFSLFKSIDEQHISFKDLILEDTYVNIIEFEDGTLNLEKLVKTQKEDNKKENETNSNIKFQIYKTVLDNAKIKFTKFSKNKEPYKLNIHNLNYTFYDMGTYRNTLASHNFKALINTNTELTVNGGLRLDPFEMNGVVELKNFKPKEFLVYKEELLNFDLSDKTYLNLKFGFKVDTKKDLKVEINEANLDIKNLDIKQNNNSILSLKQLALDDLNLNYPENIIKINSLYFNELNSQIINNKNNILNLTNLINIEKEVPIEKRTANNIEKTVESENINKKQIQEENSKKDSTPWKVSLKELNVKNSNINFQDLANSLSMNTNINLSASNFNSKDSIVNLEKISLNSPNISFEDKINDMTIIGNSLAIDTQDLNINGSNIKINKIKLQAPLLKYNDIKNEMNISTENINLLATDNSFIDEKLQIAILSLTKSSISLEDKKNNTSILAKELSLIISDIFNYKDEVRISKIDLNEPSLIFKDIQGKTDVLAKNIYLNIEDISHKDNKLKIVRSILNKPYLSVTLGKQETSQKKEKDTKKVTNKEKTKKDKSNFAFDIGPIKIKDMKMTFEDKNLPIPFKTDITKLNGEFSRLNSNSSKPTKLSLEGTVDEYGYTKISGIVDINDIKLLTDTNLLFKNLAIKNFTPYSGKFVGREIESGKLNLDLKYNIKKSDLKAENSVIISNIKFGNTVESPDAVNLPLDLAIALLENSEGVIDLELPVKGNVDDPEFSIAPIVWKAFTNLIVKAIASPFSLLASVFGINADDIKSLEFEFGKSEILSSEKESLDNIAKILEKKQKLAITVTPVYDPIKDKLALQNIKFEQFLIKQMKKIPQGDEYKKTLEDLYQDIDKVKDLDDIKKLYTKKDKDGKEKFNNDAYVEYLHKFLASKQEVSDEELVTLAKSRISNILKYLLEVKKVSKDAVKIEEIKKQETAKSKWIIFKLGVSTK
ncbi:MAG: hypothetical protein C0625_11840 [Arcobacter sp.]|nr:MAG: hypothetical protein C0625_11840 [Arcobacter sp.]